MRYVTNSVNGCPWFWGQDLGICCSYIANSASRNRPPLRDLMDWNGAKVDHVIASRTRLEEIGIGATLRSQTSYPFVHEEWTPVSIAHLPNCSRFLATLLKSIGRKDDNVWIEARDRTLFLGTGHGIRTW